jgi:hypothetical protein
MRTVRRDYENQDVSYLCTWFKPGRHRLSARPIRDIYRIVETPDTAGLINPGDAAMAARALNERGLGGARGRGM